MDYVTNLTPGSAALPLRERQRASMEVLMHACMSTAARFFTDA
jgi:hypothetical protein